MGFSRQEYWYGLPFPSPVDHVLSELSTMTCLSWVALHGIAHSFIELGKAVVCQCDQTGYFSVIVVFRLSSLWWKRIRGLWTLPDGIGWLRGILGLVLMGGAMLSKSWIRFSLDGWSCVPSLLFSRGHTVVEVMKIIVTSLKRSQACTATVHAPKPVAGRHRPTPSPESFGHPQESPLWGHYSFLLGPGAQGSVVPSKSLFPSPM